MRSVILKFEDANMAGYEWSWAFFLDETADGRFTVSCKQTVKGDAALRIPARRGLRDGAEVYGALRDLMDEAGYSIEGHDLAKIICAVKAVDPALLNDFLNGEAILEQRDGEASRLQAERREQTLAPYREAIDAYVLRFGDQRGRYGPSPRFAAIKYIEEYVIEHGRLPHGIHTIRLSGPVSYSGGQHDFSDLAASDT
jgi:hypothetical protein